MIRINLLGEKQDKSGIYAIQLLVFFGVLLVSTLSCFFIYNGVSSSLEQSKRDKQLLETNLAKLKERTKEVEDLEKKRTLLKEKLSTIAQLKARKHGPVHVIDELTARIPERSWLTSAKQKGGQLALEGVALDNQTVAAFIQNLQGSPYFGPTELIFSKEYMVSGVKMTQFSLSVQLKNLLGVTPAADKAEKEGEKKK